MDNKIIIFGSGKIGHKALDFLGYENIMCFCDNNPKLVGTERYGKTVISFDELKWKYSDAVILIAAGDFDTYVIAKQCEENGIPDYVFYKFVTELYPEWTGIQLLDYMENPMNRIQMRYKNWFKRAKELQRQVDFLKNHADIRHIKPATGRLRARQLECVQVSAEFFEKIHELGIKPILYGGCLLGYVRHKGFIPWDDDMDFALVRDEYETLKAFCRRHIQEEHETADKGNGSKNILEGLEDYFWGTKYNYFCVYKKLPDGRPVYIEFFSLDYYADTYEFGKLKKYAGIYMAELDTLDSDDEKVKYVEKALIENKQNAVKESSHIFWGIDNMEFMAAQYPREQFIPREVVFPLKNILFEGGKFWVPNNAEEFLTYELWNIWEFPRDVGLQRHCEIGEDDGNE